MTKKIVQTANAPAAIGCYSQAVVYEKTVYLAGQIGLNPTTMELQTGIAAQIQQVLENLSAVCVGAGGTLGNIAKLNVYLTDLSHFAMVNDMMSSVFSAPYPARALIGVAALPRGALIEMDAVMVLD